MKQPTPQLPEVNFSDCGDIRYLHLGTEWVQGSMRLDKPFEIELEYLQRMMAWLLFMPPASLPHRHAMQLGLGAGALTKFCWRKLRMKTTAIELNPQVIAACRLWFKLPPDDARLSVILGDAADAVRNWGPISQRREAPRSQRDQDQRSRSLTPNSRVDALQVDLYDQEAAAPVLDSVAFYADCRGLLTDDGCMAVNLFGRSSSFSQSLEKIRGVFGPGTVWAFQPTREGNTIVVAVRSGERPDRPTLAERAETIETRWGLPARKWLRVFKPVET